MCGIMAYIGSKEACPIILEGLKKLEYRGYDSVGLAVLNGSLNIHKKEGKVSGLESYIFGKKTAGKIAIGHTRWATHGEPNDTNAHPHRSQSGRLVLVHNGIIENYQSLKSFLELKGVEFQSVTDSEVLVQYIEWYQIQYQLSTKEAVRRALGDVDGSYAIVVIDTLNPNSIIAAKKDSPLVIGSALDGFYLASDAGPICKYTNQMIYLQDGEIAQLKNDGQYKIWNLQNDRKQVLFQKVELVAECYQKGDYEDFMLKEIFQQPSIMAKCISDRINADKTDIRLPAIDNYRRIFEKINRVIIVACGTSWHAGLIGEYLIEQLANIAVEVEYASEFRYRQPIILENDLIIAISQSGETADTLAALKLANSKNAFSYGIVNTKGSSIARHADAVSYINAGVEIGVASTKAFTAQVSLLTLFALKLGSLRNNLSNDQYQNYLHEFSLIPEKIEETLRQETKLKKISHQFDDKHHALFLGRGINFPVALEGALKLKEISYIHAEGYPAAEMKHGPIALIDANMPVVVVGTNQDTYNKLLSNVEEIKSRKGQIILIKNQNQEVASTLTNNVIDLPETLEVFCPILTVIPLQILSYYAAKNRGCNVDQPRNLAKSVTVE